MEHRTSRRSFLATTAATGAAVLCTGRLEAATPWKTTLKKALIGKLSGFLKPVYEKRQELVKDMNKINDILSKGAVKACEIAAATLKEAKEAIGI